MQISEIPISTALRLVRAKLNLSQSELADQLGVSFATINRWEGGKRKPQRAALEALSKLFDQSDIKNANTQITPKKRTKKPMSVANRNTECLRVYVRTDQTDWVQREAENKFNGDRSRLFQKLIDMAMSRKTKRKSELRDLLKWLQANDPASHLATDLVKYFKNK